MGYSFRSCSCPARDKRKLFTNQQCVHRTKFKANAHCRLTVFQKTHFRLFQTERVCRRQFQIDENGRNLWKWVENTVGKGEIARNEQFLLFPQCFQNTRTADTWKPGLAWERVNVTKMIISMLEIIENIVEKGEPALFSFLKNIFKKTLFFLVLKVRIVQYRMNV